MLLEAFGILVGVLDDITGKPPKSRASKKIPLAGLQSIVYGAVGISVGMHDCQAVVRTPVQSSENEDDAGF